MREGRLQWICLALAVVQLAAAGAMVCRAITEDMPGAVRTEKPPAPRPRGDRVTEANYYRVQDGMSRSDVEAILGPPRDYSTGPLVWGRRHYDIHATRAAEPVDAYQPPYPKTVSGGGSLEVVEWRTDKGMIRCYFVGSGQLRHKYFDEVRRVAGPQEARVSEENFSRVQPGMNRGDVQAILGPPCDYSTGPLVWAADYYGFRPTRASEPTGAYLPPYQENVDGIGSVEVVEWRTDKRIIQCSFGPSGRLRHKQLDQVRLAAP